MPEGGYYLTARINLYEHFNHSQVFNACIDYLAKALEKLGLLDNNLSAKLLLVFPDHTRTAIATHLLLDAIFYFKETYNHLQFTILFGLGTHPPMTDESVSQYLGEERYRKLTDLGVIIRQQTTIAPVKPQVKIKVQDQLKLDEVSDYSFASLNWNTAQLQQQLHQSIAHSHAVNLSDLDENLLIKNNLNSLIK
ncbi:lactate racemase domain-containing protein [Synechocystis salina]|uniref:lactate racemase domain-containing protein n=1 Tax=Synechocystis salina TaxID=945780 RepID=UPI001D1586D3|nr:lactate racemase domain-containing protein [Synechocystis salina]